MNKQSPFAGFDHYDATFVFCPNAYLDYCVNSYDRGVVRTVGFVLYETLRWVDTDGQPKQENIPTSYSRLISDAGVGRSSIRAAIDKAVEAGFIECVQVPQAKRKGRGPTVGEYRIRWSDSESKSFCGFRTFGQRTMVPHAFFTDVLPHETLGVIRVVAAVIRNTVGYETKVGRRQQAPLSYSRLQSITNLSRGVLADGVRSAVSRGFVEAVEPGRFSSDQQHQKATVYKLRWAQAHASVRKPNQHRFEIRSSKQPESEPAEQCENRTSIKELTKQNSKQHAADESSVRLLIDQGFDQGTARRLAQTHSAQEIQNQTDWIDCRSPRNNRLGMLRRAIEQDWPAPDHITKKSKADAKWRQQQESLRLEERRVTQQKQDRIARKQRLEGLWLKLSHEQRLQFKNTAIASTSSISLQSILQSKQLDDPPATEFLDALARDRGLPTIIQPDSTDAAVATDSPLVNDSQPKTT